MKFNDHKEFFDSHENDLIQMRGGFLSDEITVEEMYLHFKARPPIPGMTQVPMYLELPCMDQFFIAFVRSSLGKDEVLEHFTKETGLPLPIISKPKNGFEKMIDDVCGVNTKEAFAKFIAPFADFLVLNYWGDANNPEHYKDIGDDE